MLGERNQQREDTQAEQGVGGGGICTAGIGAQFPPGREQPHQPLCPFLSRPAVSTLLAATQTRTPGRGANPAAVAPAARTQTRTPCALPGARTKFPARRPQAPARGQ